MDKTVQLKDIVWGGRIRREWKSQVWAIANSAAVSRHTSYSGGMASSSEKRTLYFLDGCIYEQTGFFDSSCGMFWEGLQVKAYILHKLGLDPARLLHWKDAPSLPELQALLKEQKTQGASQGGQKTEGQTRLHEAGIEWQTRIQTKT